MRNLFSKLTKAKYPVFLFLLLFLITTDQILKSLVTSQLQEGERLSLFPGFFELIHLRNSGAAFSLGKNYTVLFTFLSASAIIFLIFFVRRVQKTSWIFVFSILCGGIAGNLSDRIFRSPGFPKGAVVDYVSTPWLVPAVYNFADACIVLSMIYMLFLILRNVPFADVDLVHESDSDTENFSLNASPSSRVKHDKNFHKI